MKMYILVAFRIKKQDVFLKHKCPRSAQDQGQGHYSMSHILP